MVLGFGEVFAERYWRAAGNHFQLAGILLELRWISLH